MEKRFAAVAAVGENSLTIPQGLQFLLIIWVMRVGDAGG